MGTIDYTTTFYGRLDHLFLLLRHIKMKVVGRPRTQACHQALHLHTCIQSFKPNLGFLLVGMVGCILLWLLNSLAVCLH